MSTPPPPSPLSPPMNQDILQQLQAIVGPEFCTNRPEDLHCYSFDGRSTGPLPEVVVFPETTEQVSRIMQLATAHRFPVVPRGAGTGMTGGSLPVKGGVVLPLTRMNRILEIDRGNQLAVVEPGVITADLQRAVKKHGLFYPPDPASLKFSTLGGNAGECAGGMSAVKYGVTKDFIMGLEVVLPSGEVITTGTRTEKGVTGYDLTRLFVGSEGTLGIITRLICRLLPLPEARETFLISSETLSEAAHLVATILGDGIRPCTLEYMDRTAIKVVSSFLATPPPPTVEALLLLELDGTAQSVTEEAKRLTRLLAQHPTISVRQAADEEEAKSLWQARRSISPAAYALTPDKIGEDVAVPRTRIPDLVAFCEQLAGQLQLLILTYGHAGDGNIHVNIMLDKQDPRQAQAGEEAKRQLFERTIALGGTLSGEHGIGTTKAHYLPLELNPATIRTMQRIKDLFDPFQILNPGKIFPQE